MALDELFGAIRARHDHPVVAGHVDRTVVDRLDFDQRAENGLAPRTPKRVDERRSLRRGPGDDPAHRHTFVTVASHARARFLATLAPGRRPGCLMARRG